MSNAVDRRLRAALHELAEAGRPVNLADAALRGAVRRRRTRSAMAIGAAAVVVGVLAVLTAGLSLRAGPAQPAAGSVGLQIVSSYRAGDMPQTYLLDPATGRYRPSPYSWGVVSPDGRQAAVLPALGPDGKYAFTRIGLLNLRTQAVRWVTTPQPVATPVWSPDGKTLLATVVPPDGLGSGGNPGFLRVDVASGRVTATRVARRPVATAFFVWGPDATTVISSTDTGTPDNLTGRPGGPTVYDLTGRPVRHLDVPGSVLSINPWSPSGSLVVLDGEGAGGRPQQLVVEPATDRVLKRIDTPHPALGWRDDTHLLVRTDEGEVQSVDIATGTQRTVATLPERDVEDVVVTSATDLPPAARRYAF